MPSLAVLPISPMPSSPIHSGRSNAMHSVVQRIEEEWEDVTFEPDFDLFSLVEFENETEYLAEKLTDIKKKFESLDGVYSKVIFSPEEKAKFQEYMVRQGTYISQCLYIVREMASNPDALDDPAFKALIKPGVDNEIGVLKGLKQEIKAFMREVNISSVKPYKKANEALTIGLPVSGAVGILADGQTGGALTILLSVIKFAIFLISGKERKKTECKELIRDISQSLINFLDERIDMPDNIGKTTAATYMRTAAIQEETTAIRQNMGQAAQELAVQSEAINSAAGALTSLEIRLLEENKQLKEQLGRMEQAQATSQEMLTKIMAAVTKA